MFGFSVIKNSKKSHARLGLLETPHGTVETPAFVPVATQAAVKVLTEKEAEETGSQLLICNTYHLHLRPGEKVVKKHGGLHAFMQWKRPLMTDSGGFQVFSLGFGREHGMGKILKEKSDISVTDGDQPAKLKITDDGVLFRSHIDGRELFLNPRESLRIQGALGADIMIAFDECPPPTADYAYVKTSLARTHRWAKESLDAKRSMRQALYGVVQGGRFQDLREESARFIGKLGFEGFAIGGEFGASKRAMTRMLRVVFMSLPPKKPRHLLGIGHPEDILPIIKSGVDTFDCIVPTHYGRRGIAFTSEGKLNLARSMFLEDKQPLDASCECFVCGTYARGYLAHLVRAREITALRLLTFHNLHFFNAFAAGIRARIREGKI